MPKETRGYIVELLLSLDQLGNVLIGGHHDETISSTLGKLLVKNELKGKPIAKALSVILDALDENHCLNSAEWDEGESFDDMFGKYKHHRRDGLH